MKKMFFIPFLGTLGIFSALGIISIADDIYSDILKKKRCKRDICTR